jgi:hypothetical protein
VPALRIDWHVGTKQHVFAAEELQPAYLFAELAQLVRLGGGQAFSTAFVGVWGSSEAL